MATNKPARKPTATPQQPPGSAIGGAKRDEARLDDALEHTFPASDPVALKAPKRGAAPAATPKVTLPEDALPAEKPA